MDENRGLWRGKRLNDGEWVQGLLAYRDFSNNSVSLYQETERDGIWVDPSTLGECTGLRDKNGKLIFEGDIISFMESTEKYYITKWDKENACFYYDRDVYVKAWCASQYGIVVGNVHDNPEMMKGDEDYG